MVSRSNAMSEGLTSERIKDQTNHEEEKIGHNVVMTKSLKILRGYSEPIN